MNSECLYILLRQRKGEDGEIWNDRVKIGYATNINQRLNAYLTEDPEFSLLYLPLNLNVFNPLEVESALKNLAIDLLADVGDGGYLTTFSECVIMRPEFGRYSPIQLWRTITSGVVPDILRYGINHTASMEAYTRRVVNLVTDSYDVEMRYEPINTSIKQLGLCDVEHLHNQDLVSMIEEEGLESTLVHIAQNHTFSEYIEVVQDLDNELRSCGGGLIDYVDGEVLLLEQISDSVVRDSLLYATGTYDIIDVLEGSIIPSSIVAQHIAQSVTMDGMLQVGRIGPIPIYESKINGDIQQLLRMLPSQTRCDIVTVEIDGITQQALYMNQILEVNGVKRVVHRRGRSGQYVFPEEGDVSYRLKSEVTLIHTDAEVEVVIGQEHYVIVDGSYVVII